MPRIRSARVITSTKTGQKALMVRMERLEPLSRLSEREAYMLLVDLVGRESALKARENQVKKNVFLKSGAVTEWRGILKRVLDSHSSGMSTDGMINDDWLEAYTWVRNVARDQGYNMDLHSDNWMFRRTQYGPQLVITDPFSWKKLNPNT